MDNMEGGGTSHEIDSGDRCYGVFRGTDQKYCNVTEIFPPSLSLIIFMKTENRAMVRELLADVESQPMVVGDGI